ncbi:hypothetical protein JCGZ_10503 [Jatropha curcas]|uniref:Uncharacterized protein n=1 Tax=Jatropha curcas TaxID=180498 RepID=A0A067KHQ7_JATCU|nr:hypothetical protein JCGZ_10503 [Jatropha curcas]
MADAATAEDSIGKSRRRSNRRRLDREIASSLLDLPATPALFGRLQLRLVDGEAPIPRSLPFPASAAS